MRNLLWWRTVRVLAWAAAIVLLGAAAVQALGSNGASTGKYKRRPTPNFTLPG